MIHIAIEIGVTPGSAALVNAHRFIHLDSTGNGFSWRKTDFTHWHSNVRAQLPANVNAPGIGAQLFEARFKRFFGRDHSFTTRLRRGEVNIPSPALPGAGSTGLLRT